MKKNMDKAVVQALASCNKSSRDKALKHLKSWLPLQQEVSGEEMKKIWKGLFYCVWHADKPLVQSDLIDRLSSFLLTLDLPLSLHYFSTFLLTLRREWSGIDFLRLDKFYLLIRRFFRNFFILLKKNSWDLELSRRFVSILEEKAFFAEDKFTGDGVNYQIATVFLDEIKPSLPAKLEVLRVIFEPFVSALGKSQNKVLVGKVKSNVFEFLLKMGRNLLEAKKLGRDGDGEEVLFGPIALKFGFADKFYELGSSSGCIQGNRKVLFGLHEEFLKLDKDLAASGIEISVPEVSKDNDDEEVPELVPINEEDNGPTKGKHSKKKSKKEKDLATSGIKISIPQVSKAFGDEVVPKSVPIIEEETVEAANGPTKDKHSNKKSKKEKKKGADGVVTKAKRKKNGLVENGFVGAEDHVSQSVVVTNDNSNDNTTDDENVIAFNESVISNLQMQFEKVAAENVVDKDIMDSCDSPPIAIIDTVSKKKKRARNMDVQETYDTPDLSGQGDAEGDRDTTAKGEGKSVKKVRFSMKNNLVWKPHSPLPPQSLRIPPSVTPRGSALKKGLSPGPIREIHPSTEKVKRKSLKKGRKVIKSISPAGKRLKKLKSQTS
ncbi:Ribosomal RNA processing protein 1-like [Dillenia turbinata]|uniref:Ribosomal RNA processing protein 1-like n=1 Tax=Dillenia turbinata TaxID=194707 RepID=A0AAN8W3D2_9MAGN